MELLYTTYYRQSRWVSGVSVASTLGCVLLSIAWDVTEKLAYRKNNITIFDNTVPLSGGQTIKKH